MLPDVSGAVVKIVLPRWQEWMRGRGSVLGCVVWAAPEFAHRKFLDFSHQLNQFMLGWVACKNFLIGISTQLIVVSELTVQ